jgi:hypothetical protein
MRGSRVVLLAAVAVVCAGGFLVAFHQPASSPIGPSAARNAQAFQAAAADIADEWTASPAAAIWHDGLILLSDPVISDDGSATDWVYQLPAKRPVPPATAAALFPDGTRLSVRVTTLAEAVRVLAPDPHGQPARITRAVVGTARFLTNHGIATLPAWRLTVLGVPGTVAVAAVAATDLAELPNVGNSAGAPPGLDPPGEQRPANPNSVTVLAEGGCDHGELLVYETKTVVVVAISRPAAVIHHRSDTCGPSANPGFAEHTAPLAYPLGGRPILDIAGYPVLTTVAYLRSLNA